MFTTTIRDAQAGDEEGIAALIREMGPDSPVTAAYVTSYLSRPDSGILLAEQAGQAVGLLSYSVRPDLYHAGPAALVEELVVHAPLRGQGMGSALLQAFLNRMAEQGCAEAAIAVMPDNEGAKRLYKEHGLAEEALLLEKHF